MTMTLKRRTEVFFSFESSSSLSPSWTENGTKTPAQKFLQSTNISSSNQATPTVIQSLNMISSFKKGPMSVPYRAGQRRFPSLQPHYPKSIWSCLILETKQGRPDEYLKERNGCIVPRRVMHMRKKSTSGRATVGQPLYNICHSTQLVVHNSALISRGHGDLREGLEYTGIKD